MRLAARGRGGAARAGAAGYRAGLRLQPARRRQGHRFGRRSCSAVHERVRRAAGARGCAPRRLAPVPAPSRRRGRRALRAVRLPQARAGMLLDAARALGLDLGGSWMVGDTDADIAAGAAAGCRRCWLRNPGSVHKRLQALTPISCRAAWPMEWRDLAARNIERRFDRNGAVMLTLPRSQRITMLDQISTRIFADGADLDGILALAADPRIAGFTTNPTLMRKAGLTDYDRSPRTCSSASRSTRSPSRCSPTTAEEMRRQARMIASWGENVYVKIPSPRPRASRWRRSPASSPRME